MGVAGVLQHELEQMVWEVDENLDNKIDEQEFELMYKKCIEDKVHLEPNGLFLLTLFLMYCKKTPLESSGRGAAKEKQFSFSPFIVSEDTYSLIYARFDRQLTNGGQRERLDQEIKMIFQDRERNPDGTDRTISYQEFVDRVNENIISFRREFKEKQKNLAKASSQA